MLGNGFSPYVYHITGVQKPLELEILIEATEGGKVT